MLKLNHKRLDAWRISLDFIKDIYRLTANFPRPEIYGITSQLRRAAISVASNIAEGASRQSKLERKRFYSISRSSLVEVDTQLEISGQLNFIIDSELTEIDKKLNRLFAMLTNMINKTQ